MTPHPPLSDDPPFSIRVSDLKQYCYCPRVSYYQIVLPRVRPTTYHMAAGLLRHVQAEGREKRRSLRTYGLSAGQRRFNVPLWSPELGLSGEVDLLIETDAERIPVDYKDSERAAAHFRLQLAAYGRLLQETAVASAPPVRRGFLYLIPLRQAVEVPFTAALQRQLSAALAGLRAIAEQQVMPPPTTRAKQCLDCEFRRFCNDI